MEATKYVFRDIQSIPMYDKIMDSYHVLIDNEMVEIPSELFHKMFRESTPEDDPTIGMRMLDGGMIAQFIEAIKNEEGELGHEMYEHCKDTCRIALREGVDKTIFKLATNSLLKLYDQPESIPKFEELIDKIFGELESEN